MRAIRATGCALAAAAVAAGCVVAPGPAGAATFSPSVEAKNYAITFERQADYNTLGFQLKMLSVGTLNGAHAEYAQLADPGREFVTDLCWSGFNACAGDVSLYDWASKHYGIVRPVLFTARNGATLSGHVWATVAGPAKRPGIVITDGSVQADEQMYWYAAEALAKAGYVVLTFDPQGQGQSDTFGTGADAFEGVPAQTDGRPFYDGTEDAINFLLSTPASPYQPVPSCQTGTSHADKQYARVHAGLDTGYNPFWQLLDPSEIGLAGHSYGAAGVSYVAQWDPRVSAVVAWDNLGGPSPNGAGGGKSSLGEQPCPADPANRTTVPITKPGLGISADYGLPPLPNTSTPDSAAKSTWSHAYSAAGVDTGQIIIRGGSHLDFSYIPLVALGASRRGPDLTAWYTTAWFDKYLKHDPSADARLLTDRWRHDLVEARIDPSHDGNAFSFYYPSRLDVTLASGQRWTCGNLRAGCAGLGPDGRPAAYSYLATDRTADAATGPGAAITAHGANSLYRENLTPTQIAQLAALLPKNLAFTIQHGFLP
jgi:dienelactone hydrolase